LVAAHLKCNQSLSFYRYIRNLLFPGISTKII